MNRQNTAAAGLLDTSVVITLEEVPAEFLPGEMMISAVTLAELAAGPHLTSDPIKRARRQQKLQAAEAAFDPLPFDARAAREYGAMVAAAQTAGRTAHRRCALDCMVAATARANGLPLYTRNPSHFDGLEDLVEIVFVVPAPCIAGTVTPETPPEGASN